MILVKGAPLLAAIDRGMVGNGYPTFFGLMASAFSSGQHILGAMRPSTGWKACATKDGRHGGLPR